MMNYSISRNFGGPVDIDGNPVQRTKVQYPYSYDPHLIGRLRPNTTEMDVVYSDRMRQWDCKKYGECVNKHLPKCGDYWPTKSLNLVQNVLRDYFDSQNLELYAVLEGANHGNGYPYWVFYYKIPK